MIRWKTYGTVGNVDVHYATGVNLSEDQWEEIEANIVNNDSLAWTPAFLEDSVRIRIKDSSSELNDFSGWYFSVTSGLQVSTSIGNAVINNVNIRQPVKSR